ncbi:hypothetical protein SOCE26_099400 [Sorangium cellulosum]|uniref:Uncharacterized protein n=1 Tax=Sorangium cellulosum TaxID=56 RepID=A0A2L0F9Y3_SORCE|nr:hypothetical protein [Sorangium cellulosum]AUX48406.1 hypothetical protein SOCE26_099400 [Sorangium cellulosum]
MERWRGLKDLVQDAVDHGSRAVERLQKHAAKLPFDLLEQIPPISAPVRGIRLVHDTMVSGVHVAIRLVNRVAGYTIDGVLFVVEQQKEPAGTPDEGEASAPGAPAGRRGTERVSP